ncbi:MAG: hypothetical protein V4525_04840 [Pseudomonadota bacterium]
MKFYILALASFFIAQSVVAQPTSSTKPAEKSDAKVEATKAEAAAMSASKNFEPLKKKQLEFVDDRIARLQELKICVEASTAIEGLKRCQEKFRENSYKGKVASTSTPSK